MRFKRENKGFSLIELIVVIAIFSVVGVVVGGFLLTASRSYAVSANELDLQEEAQLVANQVQEMILDTSYGIAYQFVGLDDEGNNLIKYMENDAAALPAGSTISRKDLYIYGKDHYYHIFWDKEAAQILLEEYEKNAEDKYVLVEGMPTTGVLFGEYISDFKVDLSKVASDRMVSFNITFKKKGSDRDYMVARTVSLRNNVMTNKSAEDIYEAAGEEFQPAADQMDISPDEYSMWPEEALHYTVLLRCTNGGVPSQQVNWTLNPLSGEELDSETKINASNILKIGKDEKNSQIQVVATVAGYDYSTNEAKTLSETCLVNVRQITGLSIVSNDFDKLQVSRGGTYEIKVRMDGNYLPDSLEGTGGIFPVFIQGGTYATIEETNVDGLVATYTVEISNNAPAGGKIELSFRPVRPGYTSLVEPTDVYSVSDAEQIVFDIKSGNKDAKWLRLGASETELSFKTDELKNKYTDPENGDKLLADHAIRYTYKLYDSGDNLIETAFGIAGSGGEPVVTPCINSIVFNENNLLTSRATLSDKVFLQSGKVVVSAELLRFDKKTSKYVVLGKSDEFTYGIPEATLRFRRSSFDEGETEMISYITRKQRETSIYIEFADGFADSGYTISLDKVECHIQGCNMDQCDGSKCKADDFVSVDKNSSSEEDKKIVVEGVDKKDLYTAEQKNKIVLSYDNIPAPNLVTIVLATPNVANKNYYVPLDSSEWTLVATRVEKDGKNTISVAEYVYYIDKTHKMEIIYKNNKFSSAKLCELVGLKWDNNNAVSYKMSTSDNSWKNN